MTDVADNDLTDEPDDDFPAKPPPIEPWTVPGAEGLPDDVKNGDIENPTS